MPPTATITQQPQKRDSAPRAQQKIKIYQNLVGQRSNFESYWQSLHDYFYIESQDVNKSSAAGSELTIDNLYDATTLESADVLASGFMNYLTPPTSKWFRLRHRNPKLSDNKKIGDWLEGAADEVNYTLNRSNFYDTMFPTYKSSGVYGTSLLIEEEDIYDDARFFNMPVKQVCIVEDARGRVVEYYIEFEYTALQAATRWGIDSLSQKMQQEVKDNKEQKHKFLLVIGLRSIRDVRSETKENLPIEALWIDMESKAIIEEGGYNEFPAMCHRFDKRPFIAWGFSPAMKALPFARLLNAISKTTLRSFMKNTDPSIAAPNNAFIMPFNQNPRAINYYKKDIVTQGQKDIFAIGNYGNPELGMNAVEYYSQKVKSLMFYDVFLAFEGLSKQMNNPEVMERINEKMALLGPSVGRFLSEVLHPIVIRTMGILFRRGKLPEPPNELLMEPYYEIDFVGQLAQAQRRTELNTLVTALGLVGEMANVTPAVIDKIDPDKVTDETWAITGAPVRVLRDDEEVAKIRSARAQEQAKIQELQMLNAGSDIVKKGSEAERNLKQSKEQGK